MDAPQKSFYRLQFRLAFLEKRGTEFEAWFARIAGFALGPDFERIKPHGAEGDRKADARSRRDRTIYQCYAPTTLRRDRLIAKLDQDFEGAVEYWGHWMKRWVFVHDDIEGLSALVHEHLDALRDRHPSVSIEVWGEVELIRLADQMDLAGWESVFPGVPSQGDTAVAPEDIAAVVQYLEQADPAPGQEPIRPPSVDKIARNDLSADVQSLLRVGQHKDHLVRRFFVQHHTPDLGERIAEAFRRRYRELREREHSPDDIFVGLQRAFGARGTAKREVASLAVLNYLFDRCDIFEDPGGDP